MMKMIVCVVVKMTIQMMENHIQGEDKRKIKKKIKIKMIKKIKINKKQKIRNKNI